jgi:hypothetical protein
VVSGEIEERRVQPNEVHGLFFSRPRGTANWETKNTAEAVS